MTLVQYQKLFPDEMWDPTPTIKKQRHITLYNTVFAIPNFVAIYTCRPAGI